MKSKKIFSLYHLCFSFNKIKYIIYSIRIYSYGHVAERYGAQVSGIESAGFRFESNIN